MAKGRADLSFQPIADAITKVETAVRRKQPVNAQHLKFLDGLRSILEAYCQTQRRPADCGDYCFLASPRAAGRRRKRARR
jgi:hypothetical protein